jgi:lysophospholipase L1-like esterase
MMNLALAEPVAPVPPEPKPSALPAGLNVLIVGDSNTEIGHISGGLARRLEENFGFFGTGYRSLSAIIGMGSGYLPYLKLSHDPSWELYAMVGGPSKPAKPFLSPDGTGLMGKAAGLTATVEFWGTAIDIFSLAGRSFDGEFSAEVDGRAPLVVKSASAERTVRKTTVSGLKPGWHTLRISTLSASPVLLLGVNAQNETSSPGPVATVHKWGKGWATTADFAQIDETVFTSAVRELSPDVTVVLLGTNDHNLAGNNRDQFAANLRVILDRIRSGAPQTKILVVSTIQVNSPWSNNGLKEYRGILPELCKEAGVSYWDMSGWFGTYAENKAAEHMLDNVHVNEKGGDKIAGQLFEEVLRVATQPALTPAPNADLVRTEGSPLPTLPAEVPGLVAWWSAAGGLTQTADGLVSLAVDQSGQKTNADAPWQASRPSLVKVEGLPVLRFDGKGNHLRFSRMLRARTIILLARIDYPIFGHPYFNTRPFSMSATKPGKALSSQYASEAVTKGLAFLNGKPVVPGDQDEAGMELDGENFQILSMVFQKPVEIGYFGWGGSWNFDRYVKGEFAELLVYDRALTDTELRTIEADLVSRWIALPGVRAEGNAIAP